MHEAAIAENLLAAIIEEAGKHGGRPLKATVTCGQFEGLNEDALSFALEAISHGTVCEGMKIEVSRKPIQGKCNACGKRFDFDIASAVCTACGSGDYDLLPDEPLVLKSIDFEME